MCDCHNPQKLAEAETRYMVTGIKFFIKHIIQKPILSDIEKYNLLLGKSILARLTER